MFELRITSIKKKQFYVFTLIPFISCVGEGWVQAGLRPGQRRLREAGSAASTLRSTEHVLEGAESCPHHPRLTDSHSPATLQLPLCRGCFVFVFDHQTVQHFCWSSKQRRLHFFHFWLFFFFLICWLKSTMRHRAVQHHFQDKTGVFKYQEVNRQFLFYQCNNETLLQSVLISE